jgi:hypothetical protein
MGKGWLSLGKMRWCWCETPSQSVAIGENVLVIKPVGANPPLLHVIWMSYVLHVLRSVGDDSAKVPIKEEEKKYRKRSTLSLSQAY